MVKIIPRILFLIVSLFFIIPMNLQINASNENSKIDTNKTLAFIPGTDKLPDSYIWTQNSSPCSAGEAYCYQDTTGNYQHGIENTQNNDLPPADQSVNDNPNGNTSRKSGYGGDCTIFGGCVNEGVCELTDIGGINGQCVAPRTAQPTSCNSQSGRANGCNCEQSNNTQCASQYCGGPYRVEDVYRRGSPKTIGTCQSSTVSGPSVTPGPSSQPLVCGIIGDPNADGMITDADALFVGRMMAGLETSTPDRIARADVNNDAIVDSKDQLEIRKYVTKLITTFRACNSSNPPQVLCPPETTNPNTTLKNKGDANCSGTITIQDYNLWRDEFIAKEANTTNRTKYADFNGGDVTISDYNIWRDNFIATNNGTN